MSYSPGWRCLMRSPGSPEELQRRRERALALLRQGYPPVEVAERVGVDRRSVRRWKAAVRERGAKALRAQPVPGRPRKLDAPSLKELKRDLLKGAQAAGFPTDLWTCPLIAHLVFLDETGFLMAPLVCRTWAPRGQTPVFYQRGGSRQKVSCMGALAVPPRRHRLHFYFRLHPNENINTDRALDFLLQLLRQLPGNLVVIWDSARTHRARKVEAFLYRHLRLYLEYFP